MSIYLMSGGKGLETFGILISSKFYLNTNSSPVAPPRGETDICAMRSRTFLYEIQFPTTFILSFFLWDAYFRQHFVFTNEFCCFSRPYFTHIPLSSPLAPLRGEIDTCAQGFFYTKFDFLQLLS